MANDDGHKLANGHSIRPVVLAFYFIGVLLSGAGGNYLWMRNVAPEVVRPDPFTGSEGAALKQKVANLEQEVRQHLSNHPDVVNRFDRRITILETRLSVILENQERILERLDEMNGR